MNGCLALSNTYKSMCIHICIYMLDTVLKPETCQTVQGTSSRCTPPYLTLITFNYNFNFGNGNKN